MGFMDKAAWVAQLNDDFPYTASLGARAANSEQAAHSGRLSEGCRLLLVIPTLS